jgi:hypothetical protein
MIAPHGADQADLLVPWTSCRADVRMPNWYAGRRCRSSNRVLAEIAQQQRPCARCIALGYSAWELSLRDSSSCCHSSNSERHS